jgi:hypothetical protein
MGPLSDEQEKWCNDIIGPGYLPLPTKHVCPECPNHKGKLCDSRCVLNKAAHVEIPMPPPVLKQDFARLGDILDEVYAQAAYGKGQERHANNKPWHAQPWVDITNAAGIGFLTGQALKKTTESRAMDTGAACKEMLGAMHYLAMAIHYRRTHDGTNN